MTKLERAFVAELAVAAFVAGVVAGVVLAFTCSSLFNALGSHTPPVRPETRPAAIAPNHSSRAVTPSGHRDN
jgi:hypothetical protein